MPNKVDAIACGIGTVRDVCQYYNQILLDAGLTADSCEIDWHCLERWLRDETHKRGILAVACAILNSRIPGCHWLHSVDEKCRLEHTILADDAARIAIGGMIGD